MNTFLLRILLLLCAFASVAVAQPRSVSYDDVMVIVNDNSWHSVEIGKFFAERRKIPERNICHINVDTSESMDSARFIPLRWQIQSWMRERNLVDSINYIVTTKGCPLRVRTSTWDKFDSLGRVLYLGAQCSFEDCLTLMNGSDSSLILTLKSGFAISRYYGSARHFRRDPEKLPMYLVTRLDAYTIDQVKGYITKAENPALVTDGLWVIDVDPTRGGGYKIGNDWMLLADSVLRYRGMNVVLNTDTVYVRGQQNLIGYVSWGSNDGHSGGGEQAKPGNTWLNGSIAETYVSTGGRSFMTGAGYGQSLVADWIAEGASAVKGYTDEPYLSVMAEPHILFDRYTAGFNMAESYWSASPLLAWRQVVIGDPKMRPRLPLEAATPMIDFGRRGRYDRRVDTIRFHNAYGRELEIVGVDVVGKGAPRFATMVVDAGSFPHTLAAGDSLTVAVAFNPTLYQADEAQARVRYRRAGAANEAEIVTDIQGVGLRPLFNAPDTLRYTIPETAPTLVDSVTVENLSSTDSLVIRNLTVTAVGTARFQAAPASTLPDTIPPGGSWNVGIIYTPSLAGTDSATLNVYTTGEPTIHRVKLYGTGGVSDVEPVGKSAGMIAMVASPNPFTGSTRIRYRIPGGMTDARLELLDPLGHRVALLFEGTAGGGEHEATVDGEGLPSGIYLCRLIVYGSDGRSVTTTHPIVHTR